MFVNPYLANVTIFAGNFAPLGWMLCQGQLLPISQYDALFALIGTTYGGDGQTTFALPDLRSRVAIHAGQGPGLANYVIGQLGGQENVTMVQSQLPAHSHTFTSLTGGPGASNVAATPDDPTNNVAAVITGINCYNTSGTAKMASSTNTPNTVAAGSSQPFSNLPPFLVMNYIICVEGIFPSQN